MTAVTAHTPESDQFTWQCASYEGGLAVGADDDFLRIIADSHRADYLHRLYVEDGVMF